MDSYLQIKNRKFTFGVGEAAELAGAVRDRTHDASEALRRNVKMRLGDPKAVNMHRRRGIVMKALISAFRCDNSREENARMNRELAEYFSENGCMTGNIGFDTLYEGEAPAAEEWLMVSYRPQDEQAHWLVAMIAENSFTNLLIKACDKFGLNGFIYFHFRELVCYHKDCGRPWQSKRFGTVALRDFESLFG